MLLVFGFVLMGCATGSPPRLCTVLSAEVQYCLQPNQGIPDFALLQQVELDGPQRHELMLSSVEHDPQGFSMAVVSPLGQSLMQVRYSAQGLQSVGGLPQVDPILVMTLLQLVYWPQASVESGLRGNFEWHVEGNQRRLESSGVVLMRVDFEGDRFSTQGRHTLEMPRYHLRIHVKNLQEGDGP
jgi:hypothetical protein